MGKWFPLHNILCLVLWEPIKIFRLPYMKSTSDEEVDKFLEAVSRRISLFCFGRVRQDETKTKKRDESKRFQNFQLPN